MNNDNKNPLIPYWMKDGDHLFPRVGGYLCWPDGA
ncbi:Uncharacterised protein [Budvicia aquatica]|uniref:Uncharacterized protein n=1 Tax=Budvicia aquatica TaxID=82979 RepID=A0A484ZZD6_9GAMM|nr:Uncharacterised protein [Budvicia aquatica]